MTAWWRTLSDEEREREYSPSSRVEGDIGPFISAYVELSNEARAACEASGNRITEVRYGAAPSQTVDLVVPTPAEELTPLDVFIHGGYWQALSKHESFFAAREIVHRGTVLAAVDYTLAPAATLEDIVDECCIAIRAVRDAASQFDLDIDAMTISGSSAGAHLAAMTTLRLDPGERPRGLILLSGVYLLEPLIGTSINEAVGLDAPTARSLSPLLFPLDGLPPTVIAYGDDETDEFKRQSQAMVDALTEAGVPVSEVELPDRNHFDVVFDLAPELTDILEMLTG